MKNEPDLFKNKASKSQVVRRGFNSIAHRYDLLNDIMTFGLHRLWKREVIHRLSLDKSMNVLDLCAGTGDLGLLAAKEVSQTGLVAALDFAPRMIKMGKKRSIGSKELRWIRGDATRLPFQSNTFDAAMVGFGLRNVESIESALIEVRRVLKPGGVFINLDTAKPEWKILLPFYRAYMSILIPLLGKILAGSEKMYTYLSDSAAAFHSPDKLCHLFEQNGFVETGYAYRPRILGGAALVWGKKGVNTNG